MALRRSCMIGWATMAILAVSRISAFAQPYPSRVIRLVVGYPPGASSDTLVRIMARGLSVELKASVIVDNRPGASATIATDYVARSAPDGYTLQLASPSSFTIASLMRKVPYDPIRDVLPICRLVTYPNLMVASKESGITSFADFVARAKARPRDLNYASAGSETTPNLAFRYFNMLAGIEFTGVNYAGNMPAMTDVLSGLVPVMIGDPTPIMPQI